MFAFSLNEMSHLPFIFNALPLKIKVRPDQLISRILLPVLVTSNRSTIIHLGCTLPHTSCNLPENLGGQPSSVSLFGLAPDGVYQAFPVTWKTGALLPHRFTLTRTIEPSGRSTLCCTFLHVTVTPRYGASCPVVFGLSSRHHCPAIVLHGQTEPLTIYRI